MLVYEGIKSGFINDVDLGIIADKIRNKYIEVVNNTNSFLVDNVIPDFISLAELKFILTSLIKERVSIKDISYIFEKINDYAEDSTKSDLLKNPSQQVSYSPL